MRLTDRLDDLDRKVLGVGRGAQPRRWWWWLLGAVAVVAVIALEVVQGGRRWTIVFDAAIALGLAFRAGTMYEAHLRYRGLRSSWSRERQHD